MNTKTSAGVNNISMADSSSWYSSQEQIELFEVLAMYLRFAISAIDSTSKVSLGIFHAAD